MKQIFAELAAGDGLREVAIRRGDEPDVDAQLLRATDARERAVLQKPEQLGLKRLAHVGDFIKENRAAVGLLDASGFLPDRAGERAFFVAEQFAFEQRFGNRGAVDAGVIRLAPLAQMVQRAGDELLAGAALAENQNARIGLRDGLDQFSQFPHPRRFADNLVERDDFAGARAQRGVFPQEPVAFGAPGHGVQQFLGRERLGNVVNRAGLDGFDGELGRRVSGDHEHGQLRPLVAGAGQKIVATHPAEPRIGDDHEKFLAREQFERLLGGFDGARGIALVFQHRLQRQAHVLLVIHDEHGWQRHAHFVDNLISALAGKDKGRKRLGQTWIRRAPCRHKARRCV